MDVVAYTDGACFSNPGPGGWSVVYTDPALGTFRGSSKLTTNNRMELIAATKAVRSAVTMMRSFPIKGVEVCSDSAYVVNAVHRSWISKWKSNGWKTANGDPVKNGDLWRKFDSALVEARKRGLAVKFTKVKGHAGNKWNEMADALAKKGAEDAQRVDSGEASC